MAVLLEDLIDKVRRRLTDQGKRLSETIEADIESLVDEALQMLAHQTAANPDARYRAYSQEDFTFAMVSGEADLSGESSLMIEYVLRVEDADGNRFDHAHDVSYLTLPKNEMGRTWYAIEVDTLFTRNDDGDATPDDGDIVIRANKVATLANLHAQLTDDLVNVVGMMIEGAPAAPQAA